MPQQFEFVLALDAFEVSLGFLADLLELSLVILVPLESDESPDGLLAIKSVGGGDLDHF